MELYSTIKILKIIVLIIANYTWREDVFIVVMAMLKIMKEAVSKIQVVH